LQREVTRGLLLVPAGAMAEGQTAVVDLLSLQNLIKRDPEGYRDDFLLQLRHFEALLGVLRASPGGESKEVAELAGFLAHAAVVYPRDTGAFPGQVMGLLEAHADKLHPTLRRQLVQALILLRNRRLLEASVLFPLFFRLFACRDKELRRLLFGHIVADVRRVNLKHRDDRHDRPLQNSLFALVQVRASLYHACLPPQGLARWDPVPVSPYMEQGMPRTSNPRFRT